MLAMVSTAMTREVRIPVTIGSEDVDAAAAVVGFPLDDEEVSAILDHIDRELSDLAGRATRVAVDSRIADLVRMVRTTHVY
ncbi:MAG: hypothetical protein WB808_04820 [Candidatus Dormiibacterota bacterium]